MRMWTIFLVWMAMVTATLTGVCAQSTTGAGEESPTAPQPSATDLSNVQKQIFRDYERFEKSLYDVAEQLRRKDPEQSEVLYRARSKSVDDRVLPEMEMIAELLRSGDQKSAQYGPAVDRQKELLARMDSILKLLKSLDERERRSEEMKIIQEFLKKTERILAGQKDVRADTLRGQNSKQLQDSQKKVADQAKDLAQDIDQHDLDRASEKESNSSSSEEKDSKGESAENKEQKDSESQPDSSEKNSKGESDSESTNKGEQSSSESSESSEKDSSEQSEEQKSTDKNRQEQTQPGKQSEDGDQKNSSQSQQQNQSQQNQSQQNQSQQDQQSESEQSPSQQQEQQEQQTPGRQQLEQARKKMEQAIEDLLKEQKDDAVKDQDAAVARLEELKAQLEEILRQLREEEKEGYLTLLEARFQNMLKRQLNINAETKRLYEIPDEARLQQNYAAKTIESLKQQEDNLIDAGKALNLLREEGSSVAFPEAVEQMVKNMQVVVNRLSQQDTGKTTQLVETLIVETLEEMIEAFQMEMKKQEQQQQQSPQQQQQQQPQDPALVDQLAELKMIRSLQLQINRITQQLGTEISDPASIDADQQSLIDDIAQRQQRVQEATYDLSVGKNK